MGYIVHGVTKESDTPERLNHHHIIFVSLLLAFLCVLV